MKWSFLSPALDELREAAQFYDTGVPGLGADFIAEVDATIDRILRFPDAWGKLSPDFRHCGLQRFPYFII